MRKVTMLLVLVLMLVPIPVLVPGSTAWGQAPSAPTNLATTEVIGSTLGVTLNWDPQSGSTFNLYGDHASPCPAPPTHYTSVVKGLATNTYTYDPTPNLGPWCYYATSVVNNVESSPSNVASLTLGNKWYLFVRYRLIDCVTQVAMPSAPKVVITEVTNGVPSNVPVNQIDFNTFNGTYAFSDPPVTYSIQITLPDGHVFNAPNPIFPSGSVVSAEQATTWYYNFVSGTDAQCEFKIDSPHEHTTTN